MTQPGTSRRAGWSRQLESYLDSEVELRSLTDMAADVITVDLTSIDRTLGIVYPSTPEARLKTQIVDYFDQHGIAVVWFDEPPTESTPAWAAWEALRRGEFDP